MDISRDLRGIQSATTFHHHRILATLFLSHLELVELILKVKCSEVVELVLKVKCPGVGIRQLHQSLLHRSLFQATSPERKCVK